MSNFYVNGTGGGGGDVTSVTGTANQVLATPTTGNVVVSLIGPYTPNNYTAHGVLIGEGTSSIVATSPGTNGEILIGSTGADPAFALPTSNSGTIVFGIGAHTLSVDLNPPVPVAYGGTGDTSLTPYSVLCGGTTSTSALQQVASLGTSGQVLTSNGASALPTWQAGSGGSGITTIDGDTGSITGTTVTIRSDVAGFVCGSSVKFVNSGTISTLNVTDSLSNTIIGALGGNATPSGSDNTGVGNEILLSLTTGNDNTAFGAGALTSIVSANSNTAIGTTALGNTTGSSNTGVGSGSLAFTTSGQFNIALGINSANSYTTSESSNLIIGNVGTLGESNVLRIGTQGTGNAQQNICYIAGIHAASPVSGNTPQVVVCDNAGNLTPLSSSTSGFVLTSNGSATPSFQAAPGGSAITTIDGDSGSITGTTVTVYAHNSSNVCGSTVKFVNSGTTSTLNFSDGSVNTMIGLSAGNTSSTGNGNTGLGQGALGAISSAVSQTAVGASSLGSYTGAGPGNIAVGYDSLGDLTSGASNTSVGTSSLGTLLTGSFNTVLGWEAGNSYTGAESSNILIGYDVTGTVGESHVIRIGTAAQQTLCYIAGIHGATPVSGNTPQVTLCDNAGNLAPISSSTSGFVLTSNGTATPSFQAIPAAGVTSIAGTANQIAASASTGAVTLSLIGPYTPATYTAHGLLVGEGTSSIVAISPNATSGIPLISQGSTTDPAYGTAVVAGGGTGSTSFTAYSVVTAGTTSTGAMGNVVGVGTTGQVLTSNGASALPTWQSTISVVNIQTFTASGTYTPTTGMVYCTVRIIGGGGGGGGAVATGASQYAIGVGGGAGEYAEGTFSAATIGSSQTVTIGTAGAANSGAAGGAGGTSSLGALITAVGGAGGGSSTATTAISATGSLGGTGGTGGSFRTPGYSSPGAIASLTSSILLPGTGASSQFGSGGLTAIGAAGSAGLGYGAGGGGGSNAPSTAANAGGAGSHGLLVITEYIT